MSDTKAVLERLLRRVGREAARYERWAQDAFARGAMAYAERCSGEANVLRMTQGFIRDELRKVTP